MNQEHALDLLMAISTRDQRTIGETDAAAWANDLADVALPEALDAVTAFNQSEVAQTRRIVAADIVGWVKWRRRQLVEAEHAAVEVGRAVVPDASRRSWRELWARLKAEQHELCQARRASVLRHPDLAAALCDEPIGYQQPSQWNGYLPEASTPRRQALVALVEEAQSRDAAAFPHP